MGSVAHWALWGVCSSGSQGSGVQGGSQRQPRGGRAAVAVGRGGPPWTLAPPLTRSVPPHTCSWGPHFPLFPGLGVCRGSPLRSGPLQSPLQGTASLPLGPMSRHCGLGQKQPGPVHLRALGFCCLLEPGHGQGLPLAVGLGTVAAARVQAFKLRQRDKQSLGSSP